MRVTIPDWDYKTDGLTEVKLDIFSNVDVITLSIKGCIKVIDSRELMKNKYVTEFDADRNKIPIHDDDIKYIIECIQRTKLEELLCDTT